MTHADKPGREIRAKLDHPVIDCDAHVLEHQRNVGAFLERLHALLVEGGVLAITVPVHPRERLIAGHLTSWNAGLLCYNLVLAGFDCRAARVLQTRDLTVLVERSPAPPRLDFDGAFAGGETAGADPFEQLRQFGEHRRRITLRSGRFACG